jgi:acetyltransferase-like isoleucine patch superfamily enzyme
MTDVFWTKFKHLSTRAHNLLLALINLRWKTRFHQFGWRSRLGRPDMLTNPHKICIGRKVLIRKRSRLEAVRVKDGQLPKIEIGDGTNIELYFHCAAVESVKIGKNVLIAGRVFVTDHDHMFDHPDLGLMCGQLRSKPVVIEDGVWLCEGCVVLKGVRIGRRAVIGANAVVTRDVPPFAVVGGVPAKVIRIQEHSDGQ